MKTFLKKTAAAAILVLFALFLVTCDALEPPESGVDTNEYTDWEYEEMPDGTALLTMYLDGTRVPRTASTGRALGLQLAKMSHDYFEVVFMHTATNTIARATWGIGQQAGISGVYRSGATGVDYRSIDPTSAAASIVFVGRKQTMTLLGVGYLTHINKQLLGATQGLTTADRSVTFTVSPLEAKIEVTTTTPIVAATGSAFTTAAGGNPGYGSGQVGASNTPARSTPLGGVNYPLFILPDLAERNDPTPGDDRVYAKYTVNGLTHATGFQDRTPALLSLKPAVVLVDKPEIIKREPRYISGGQTWYAVAQIDFETKVDLDATAYTEGAGDPVNPEIPMYFTLTPASNGIFSIVFSIPVYALTRAPLDSGGLPDTSTNGGPPSETWHITPGYGENLYNLDNGINAGGCVLLGINVTSLDWLEIFTTGIGFNH
jgi:hypothetical protein